MPLGRNIFAASLDQERQVGEVSYILKKRMVERNLFWKSLKAFQSNNR